jgi:hypothetical protein
MIAPETILKIINCDLQPDQKNQLDFASLNDQQAYFNNHLLFVYDEFSFQRKDNAVKVPENMDALWAANYCMYNNQVLPNKWFYAFITRMEYLNENTTLLYLETDVFQTWLFDYTFLASFVEREHEDENT